MNAIRQTQQLNKRELENAIPPSASWHVDYRDTAWVYVGGIPLDLSEGDVITIFSQFGNPTHLNLIRDRETGKSKGFGFLKYEDQRSCDLAVDNLTGADVLGRMLRVDHTRYKKRDDEDEDTWRIDRLEAEARAEANGKRTSDTDESEVERRRRKKQRPMLKEEKELERMLAIKENGEDEDPMKEYLIKEKREEARKARDKEMERERRHKHRHRHRDRDEEKQGRSSHRRYRRQDREEDETVRRDREEPRRCSQSVDSDGDVIGRPSRNAQHRDGKPRAGSRQREGRERHSKRTARDSKREDSSPDGSRTREKGERSRRSRGTSREYRSSRRDYTSSDDSHGGMQKSSRHRDRRRGEEIDPRL